MRQLPCDSCGESEALVEAFGLGELTDVPHHERNDHADQQQAVKSVLGTRAADREAHAEYRRLAVSNVLLPLSIHERSVSSSSNSAFGSLSCATGYTR